MTNLLLGLQLPRPIVLWKVPPGVGVRPIARSDLRALGEPYFVAYPPGEAGETAEEATADVELALDGGYGRFMSEQSFTAVDATGAIVGAIELVEDPPWPDVPTGPFIIDLFVSGSVRGTGVGALLLSAAIDACTSAGHHGIALRVESDNQRARALYEGFGFR